MAKCLICDKPISSSNANICSLKCSRELTDRNIAESMKARERFNKAFYQMLEPGLRSSPVEIPMVKIKHRWLRDRNVLAGSVVVSFDKDGVALVPDIGSNRVTIEDYVRNSKGLVEFVKEEQPSLQVNEEKIDILPSTDKKEPVKEVVKEPIKQEEDVKKAESSESVEFVFSEIEEEGKKKPVKKPVAKK